jgi:pyrroloquinoline quinone (PQQ) biosynthesis protein C
MKATLSTASKEKRLSFFDELLSATQAERNHLNSTPIIQAALLGRISRDQYVAFLTQAYHHVKHTVPLLMACGSRLPDSHAWLREAIAEYIEEEIGHEQWILDDIAACGADPLQARRSPPSAPTELMVAYAYHMIDRGNPMGFFGMVHVLEGTSTALATHAAASIQDSLQLPPAAFSYLTSHGSLDQSHVQFFESLMNRVDDAADQQAVIHGARMIYKLYGDIFRALPGASEVRTAGVFA